MIIPDRKKAAMIIVSKLGKGGETADSEQKPEEGGEMEALASDLLSALDQKSPAAVADAFRALFLACESEPQEEGEDADAGPEA